MLQLLSRRFRWFATAGVAMAAVGVFLAVGPVGLGNGPLWLPTATGGTYGWSETRTEAVAYVVPIGNHGRGAAVIDSVAVTGRQGYPAPIVRLVLIGRMTSYACTTLGPFSGLRSALAGCIQPRLRGAPGIVIPPGTYVDLAPARVPRHQPALVLELAGPSRGNCWDITSIVIHYHTGIRHYAGTFPQANVITCGPGRKAPDLN